MQDKSMISLTHCLYWKHSAYRNYVCPVHDINIWHSSQSQCL